MSGKHRISRRSFVRAGMAGLLVLPAAALATMIMLAAPRATTQSQPPSVSIPDADDERAAYDLWGWDYVGVTAPEAVTDPIGSYSVSAPQVHDDTEGDDLWTYLRQAQRSGNVVYETRANAWAAYFKNDHLAAASFDDDVGSWLSDHFYGYGLIALYEHNGDTAALAAAEDYADFLEATTWTADCFVSGACLQWNLRGAARHLLLLTRVAAHNSAYETFRDVIRDRIMTSSLWDATHGMYFWGDSQTDSQIGAGSYAAGYRVQSSFQTGIMAEALWQYWLATGDAAVRTRIEAMAAFVLARGIDASCQYSGSIFGVDGSSNTYHNYFDAGCAAFVDPNMTTALVNLLVMGYKFTGTSAYMDAAKVHLNRGTKGEYGTGNRLAQDDEVHHFVDTVWDNANSNFYLAHNKGELFYTYLIFENGGAPTVIP